MKRLLMISYHFPPAGGVTGLRTLKLARYLRPHGWEPVIHAAAGPFERTDDSHLSDLPPGVEVLRTGSWRPYGLYKRLTGRAPSTNAEEALGAPPSGWPDRLARWVRANLFFPDAKAPWIGPAVRASLAYLERHPVDALFSSGPPHTNTVVAARLKAATGLPWIADFQDPWSGLGYFDSLPLTAAARARHRRAETRVFALADVVTTVSPSWKAHLESLGAPRVRELPWGFDEADFVDAPAPAPAPVFRLTHGGTLGADRFPHALLRAVEGLPVELHFAGEAPAAPNHPRVRYHGMLPRRETLRLFTASDALLLLVNRTSNQRGRIPAKLFEYLRIGRPVLCLGDPEGDAARLVHRCGAGLTVRPDDRAALRRALEDLLARRVTGAPPEAAAPFAVERLAGELARELGKLRADS